jgi:aminotransferase
MLTITADVKSLQQSGIRSASQQCSKIGGINLGQGVCNLPTPPSVVAAAHQAMLDNHNMYSACEGVDKLRVALTKKIQQFNQIPIEDENQVLVTHGSTGAFVIAVKTLLNPGDEVILFEPFYGYHRNILQLYGVSVNAVPINMQDFSVQIDDLKKIITKKTRAIVICTPCNPCGKIFSKAELLAIGKIVEQHNLFVITDEIYEYITYPGYEHVSFAALADHQQRTITISGFSKTYNMTGWRLGYASAPKNIIERMALVQDLLYVCPTTPLQYAGLAALALPDSYYQEMKVMYLDKRDQVVSNLHDMGFSVTSPQGAYYLMVKFDTKKYGDSKQLVNRILHEAKVALVPGESFYLDPSRGHDEFRLCYSLNKEQVMQAMGQMRIVTNSP